ncbi:MAG: pyridoxal-5'-phosphate-dependent protein subunit beta [Chloroflexi bacterium]|nr:pyridoxal-phosphate dependent enzyme [Anaerolineae bacterium]RLC73967.1 MAG: pyridoxal-5'-phosphate-dependent protein subunit beta [Chloroflexota bacterium]
MSKKHSKLITGPTFEEMLHPEKIDPAVRQRALRMMKEDPLDPINLYNITWKDANNNIYYYVLPPQLTGVEAPIVVLYSKDFPTGSHKVGATYSVLVEKELTGEVDPTHHSLIWPSTGNYGIGGAWVGCRMEFDSIVILPELMSKERFDLVRSYGARLILTPGCESNVKEIYDKSKELKAQDPERIRILNQFEVFGNYRFHYYVTGNTCIELAAELKEKGIGNGKVAAYVSAMGSGGTIAAGDRLKQEWPEHKIVGLEPIQCPTVYWNGYGGHDIQGIGDKHVTWIHNVMNMDAIMCIDDVESKKGLQLLTEEAGWKTMIDRYGVPEDSVRLMAETFGISGVCNVLGAIKTAKWYGFGKDDVIITILTDAIDRYRSVMEQMTATYGKMDEVEAAVRLVSIFHKQKLDWIGEGTREARNRWHNLKYYTWVEQQGKTVEELNAQRHQDYWEAQQARVAEIDRLIHEYRGY